jgi:hypothetical protein
MRYLLLLSVLAIAACSSAPSHELPQTSDNDPTWQLNEGKWTFNENALITPWPAPAAGRLPAPATQGGSGL